MINRKISDYQKLHIEIEALKVEIEFLKTFADPPDINTGQTVRDELRAHNAALVGALNPGEKPPCDCIVFEPETKKSSAYWRYECDCRNYDDNGEAAAWCRAKNQYEQALSNPPIEKYKGLLNIATTAIDLYDNRLGWSEGRNPYAPPEFWDKLGAAIKTYQDLQEKE